VEFFGICFGIMGLTGLTSGKHTKNDGKSPFLMGKSPLLMGKPLENHGKMVIYMVNHHFFNGKSNYKSTGP